MEIAEGALAEFAKTVELTGTKFLEGFHRSRRSGSGVEFHELRSYGEGEDARFIDWKRLASSDRYLVRQFERTEKTSWKIWVDSSESMTYGEKQLWAASFAGSLLYVAQALGDSWALLGIEKTSLNAAYNDLLLGRTPSTIPGEVEVSLRKEDRLVLISDFFFDVDDLLKKVEILRDRVHEVVFVQVLDSREAAFSFEGVIRFDDREGPSHLTLDARSVRSQFLKALSDLQGRIRTSLTESDAMFVFEDDMKRLPVQLAEFFGVV